jgi:peptidoglycan/xylan/chitin deacetylase (PgdA/CDA1 family)
VNPLPGLAAFVPLFHIPSALVTVSLSLVAKMFFTRAIALVSISLAAISSVSATPAPVSEKRQALAQVVTSCTVPNKVALTFDDGPYIYLKNIVDTLSNNGAVGTFFFSKLRMQSRSPKGADKYISSLLLRWK